MKLLVLVLVVSMVNCDASSHRGLNKISDKKQTKSCPNDYTNLKDTCYKFSNNGHTKQGAVSVCGKGRIPKVRNKHDLTKLMEYVKTEKSACGKGWTPSEHYCYKVPQNRSEISADTAGEICQHHNSVLPTVDSEKENAFIGKFMRKHNVYTSFIGANDKEKENVWVWANGAAVNDSDWSDGYPADKYHYCASIRPPKNNWRSRRCNGEGWLKVVCERNANGKACPSGWKKWKSRCFKMVHKGWITTDEAKQNCSAVGGELPIILSDEDNEFVSGLNYSRYHLIPIGLKDRQHNGKWTWSSGASAGYSNWMKGQPNTKRNCVVIMRPMQLGWFNIACSKLFNATSICQSHAVKFWVDGEYNKNDNKPHYSDHMVYPPSAVSLFTNPLTPKPCVASTGRYLEYVDCHTKLQSLCVT